MHSFDLLHLGSLGLLLVQLGISTWVGSRLGAFASMRILVPLPFFGFWAMWTLEGTAGRNTLTFFDVQHGMSTSLLSFFVLFAFVLPYFALLKLLPRRLSHRQAMLVCVVGATASAVGLRYLHRPAMEAIHALPPPFEHMTATVVALALMLGGHAFFNRVVRTDRREPAPCPPWNAVGRVLVLTATLVVLAWHPLQRTTAAWILSAIPRLTPELLAGVHAASGPKAAQALLAGLPLGLTPYVVFCVSYPALMLSLDVWTAYWASVALSLGSIIPLFVNLLRRRTSS